MSTTTETTTTTDRAFWPTDYQRFAAALKRSRHVKCDPSTPKPVAMQQKADELAGYAVIVFAADAPNGFDAEQFLISTQLSGQHADEGQDEDGDPGILA